MPCDVSLDDELLAPYFFDEVCVAALGCDAQAEIAAFMHEFLAALRVDAVFFFESVQFLNLAMLQQGGIPATKTTKGKPWLFGQLMWLCWMACVAFQWVCTFSAFVAQVSAYCTLEASYRLCMTELGSGHAMLNATLPLHPAILANLLVIWPGESEGVLWHTAYIMLALCPVRVLPTCIAPQVHALLMGLSVHRSVKFQVPTVVRCRSDGSLPPLGVGYFIVSLVLVRVRSTFPCSSSQPCARPCCGDVWDS